MRGPDKVQGESQREQCWGWTAERGDALVRGRWSIVDSAVLVGCE